MPTEQPQGLTLGAILERADPRDALVVRGEGGDSTGVPVALDSLPRGARVGTSSLRRQAQLLAARPDLQVLDLRGNVDTRLHKLREGQYDAVVLAVAGLVRLGHAEAISQALPVDLMLPAVGQGALCIEMRVDDVTTQNLISALDHPPTRWATMAERAFLRRLEGGCQVPIGALGQIDHGQLRLRGLVAALDGSRLVRDEIRGPAEQAEFWGTRLADQLLAAGGDEILEEVRRGS
jgi:hydroxymethylbilane synthase